MNLEMKGHVCVCRYISSLDVRARTHTHTKSVQMWDESDVTISKFK